MGNSPSKALIKGNRGNGRKLTVIGLIVLLLACTWILGPMPGKPSGSTDGFFSAALQPTLTDQSQSLPDDATPFGIRILQEMANTLRYAFIAMSIAVPSGLVLGFFASTAWWPVSSGPSGRKLLFLILRSVQLFVRLIITFMRSVHELIWAMLFLAALGQDPITACIAIALPFSGTLAKVFSEIIDEQTPYAHAQIVASGASPLQAFLTTLIPQSFPDMATYTLYRFECALRSSAILGFIGIETIGLSIRRSFENNFYNELWTELYLLLAVIVTVDMLGSLLRKRLNSIPERKKNIAKGANSESIIQALKKSAPRWKMTRLLFWSAIFFTTLSWFPKLLNIDATALTRDDIIIDRGERLSNFISKLTPQPLRDDNSWSGTYHWAQNLWQESGQEALLNTIAMATAAVIISALSAWLLLPWASRALASAQPLGTYSGQKNKMVQLAWSVCGAGTRFFFIITRAIPEYIYAYLLIGLLGISAWPLVFALALHNLGILGRLWGEVMENQPSASGKQIIYHGSGRLQAYFFSFVPTSFNRFLMYLFYRWETCVREATVLGMLGFASLGLEIQIARSFHRAYDEMFFYVLLGAGVIFLGDLISLVLRKKLKNA
ncbi:MAG: PhnE/PtxC family ABC transporter permease [Akkermansiaceae bacterium]